MCCCAQPNVNGTPGYQWSPSDKPSVRPVNPPTLQEGEVLLYDEPGRCGGQDSHCHHYRITAGRHPMLLVRHGGGEERIRLSNPQQVLRALEMLDSQGRYWLLNALYHAQADARRAGANAMDAVWHKAAAERRIKVRKVRNTDLVRVEIKQVPYVESSRTTAHV